MDYAILTKEVQQFINDHEHADEKKLVLKHKTILGIPSSQIAQQISGRRKAKEKLPTYYKTADIFYPPTVNLEQASSEQTAMFKANLLQQEIPNGNIVDLTGGLGIDTFFFSKIFQKVLYVEPNEALLALSHHNHTQLGAQNILYHPLTAEEFLAQFKGEVVGVFVDPSRRTEGNKKVFKLNACQPDVITIQKKIFEHCTFMLVKTSPLLDIKLGLTALEFVKKVVVVSIDNECKEVLFLSEKNFVKISTIEAVNIVSGKEERLAFTLQDENDLQVDFSDPKKYLYEPNASLMKAGAFKTVSHHFGISKIEPSTHLYTSNNFIANFQGRIFEIEHLIKNDSKVVAQFIPDGKANIIIRNYPLQADLLKKKLKIKDGGSKYLIAFSGQNQKFLCVANRLK